MILEFDPSIRAKKTDRVPVLFGYIQYDKAELFSYSLYENDMITEVRFEDKQVLRHRFDDNGFLSVVETFDSNSNLVGKNKFEFVEKTETGLTFRAAISGEKIPQSWYTNNLGS